MIYILNHNTSYKHSKFSARCETARCVNHPTVLLNKHPNMNTYHPAWEKNSPNFPGNVLKHKHHIFEQSKPLLCWRYDLTFFNLYSFFFGILKALHTCWYFAKNNKTIVFISTDSPSDTGVCAVTDMLTQKYTREFLPRVVGCFAPARPCVKQPLFAHPRFLEHNNNTDKFFEKQHPAVLFTHRSNGRKKTNLNHDVVITQAASRHELYNKNSITHSFISTTNRVSPPTGLRRLDHLNNALTEFKGLIHFSGVVEQAAALKNTPQNQSVAHISHHKSDGLLYKAASRRLWASFSRTKAPFFSNAKSSFRELFSHLSDSLFTRRNASHPRLKVGTTPYSLLKMGALDLNKRCLLKPISEGDSPPIMLSTTRINSVLKEPVFSVISSRFGKKNSPFRGDYSRLRETTTTAGEEGSVITTQTTPKKRLAKKSQKSSFTQDKTNKKALGEKEKSVSKSFASVCEATTAFVYDRVPSRHSVINSTNKRKHTYAFNVHYKGGYHLPSVERHNNKKNKNHRVAVWNKRAQPIMLRTAVHKQRQFYAGSTPYKDSRRSISGRLSGGVKQPGRDSSPAKTGLFTGMSKYVQRKRNVYDQHDFYATVMNQQAQQAAKRFAYSPYIQNADLVFFVNPDKNPGLASQIKKLGIPSIGIISGLKSSTYRKQPTHSNLHDSVTYPIVGNADNAAFVMMVVRIFIQLIQKVEKRAFDNHT